MHDVRRPTWESSKSGFRPSERVAIPGGVAAGIRAPRVSLGPSLVGGELAGSAGRVAAGERDVICPNRRGGLRGHLVDHFRDHLSASSGEFASACNLQLV